MLPDHGPVDAALQAFEGLHLLQGLHAALHLPELLLLLLLKMQTLIDEAPTTVRTSNQQHGCSGML